MTYFHFQRDVGDEARDVSLDSQIGQARIFIGKEFSLIQVWISV